MKLQVMSDLHLEFDPHFFPDNTGSDVLILAGDICVAEKFQRKDPSPYVRTAQMWKEFFAHCSENWKDVIYIIGNHESYHGYIDRTIPILRDVLSSFDNIHLLDEETIDLGGYRFFGATFWTDFNKGSPLAEYYVEDRLNDYRLIQWSHNYRKIRAIDTKAIHHRTVRSLQEVCKDSELPVIVVSHHAPSHMSIHERYRGDTLNYGYYSDLSEVILDNENIKFWAHGHTHTCFDYEIGDTRVVCNPRGYNNENPAFDYGKVFEV